MDWLATYCFGNIFKNIILEAHLTLLNYLISQEAKFLHDQEVMYFLFGTG